MLHRVLVGQAGQQRDEGYIYSHEIAELCGSNAAQVRRDLMAIGAAGCPSRGYSVKDLVEHIDRLFESEVDQHVALVGVGNLGRALINYFQRRYHRMTIVALFDSDPEKASRVLHGIRSYPMEQLRDVARTKGISIAIIAVPSTEAQAVADRLVLAGVKGILNFAPTSLRVPALTHVENVDITAALDKLSYLVFKKEEKKPAPYEVKQC